MKSDSKPRHTNVLTAYSMTIHCRKYHDSRLKDDTRRYIGQKCKTIHHGWYNDIRINDETHKYIENTMIDNTLKKAWGLQIEKQDSQI